MSSSKPYTRKRAVLISYKIFLCYPEALRPAFPRLKEKLEDPDPGEGCIENKHTRRVDCLTYARLLRKKNSFFFPS